MGEIGGVVGCDWNNPARTRFILWTCADGCGTFNHKNLPLRVILDKVTLSRGSFLSRGCPNPRKLMRGSLTLALVAFPFREEWSPGSLTTSRMMLLEMNGGLWTSQEDVD